MIKFTFLTALASTLLLSSCDRINQKKNEQTLQQTEEEIDSISQSMREEYEKTGEISADHTDNVIEAMEKAERNASGSDAEIMRVMRLYMEGMQKDNKPLYDASPDFDSASDFTDIKTSEDIELKLKQIKNYRTANQQVVSKIERVWPRRFDQLLAQSSLNATQKANLEKGAKAKFTVQWPLLIKIRETEIAGCDITTSQLNLLKEYWGKWSFNEEGLIDSENPTFAEALSKLDQEMQLVADQQIKVQETLLQISR